MASSSSLMSCFALSSDTPCFTLSSNAACWSSPTLPIVCTLPASLLVSSSPSSLRGFCAFCRSSSRFFFLRSLASTLDLNKTRNILMYHKQHDQGCKNRVSASPVSAVRTTENEYTGVHADNQVLPTFEILILAYILSFHDE